MGRDTPLAGSKTGWGGSEWEWRIAAVQAVLQAGR
jgi:hypothetical protein